MRRLTVYVVNLDEQTERWVTIRGHLRGFGYDPIRWSATGPAAAPDWNSQATDPERRVGIIRSYRRLLRHLEASNGDGWVVLQDDTRILRPLERSFTRPIHLYGGYQLTTSSGPRLADPTTHGHVCPKAFHLKRPALAPLIGLWTSESFQTCETWTDYLGPTTTTFDDPPTIQSDNMSKPSRPLNGYNHTQQLTSHPA